MKHFGEKLRSLRKNRGITQEALAEYLDISYQAVSKWENGLGFPEITLIPAISGFFGVSSDFLLGIELEKSEDKIENALTEARKYTHTGEIEKSIAVIEDALKTFPNDHRLLCDLIEYKVMRHQDNEQWLADIETKANLILRDCNIDKIRHKTIGYLAFAYSYSGKQDKVLETAQLLPDVAFSKKRLLSLAAPAKERAKHKAECILHESEILISDILIVAKHNIFWGDAQIAVDICNRVLCIIDSIGAEGYLLYAQADVYMDLILAYSKLQNTQDMYLTAEKVIEICKKIEQTLSSGDLQYTSPLLNGLVFNKENITYGSTQNSLERYYVFLTNAKLLKSYAQEEQFLKLLQQVKTEITLLK